MPVRGKLALAFMDNLSRGLTLLFLAAGVGIFFTIIMIKVDVLAEKAKAEVKEVSAEMEWQGYLYQQTAKYVIQERAGEQAGK